MDKDLDGLGAFKWLVYAWTVIVFCVALAIWIALFRILAAA